MSDMRPDSKTDLKLPDALRLQAHNYAHTLVTRLRETSAPGLMEQFLGEYGLSTDEGVALMCLAEALLRVPDADTMDALIEDKIAPSKWGEHLNQSSSALVNASTWGLMLTGKVLDTGNSRGIVKTLHTLVKRMGEPLIRKAVQTAMREMGKQFVLGEGIKVAIKNRHSRYRYSFDMLGEAAISTPDARRYEASYLDAANTLAPYCNAASLHDNPGISVKLSALHPRYETLHKTRVMAELLPRLKNIATVAAKASMGLNIDAEEADRLDLSRDIFETLAHDNSLADWEGLGLVIQAYNPRADSLIDWLYDVAKTTGRRFMVRLVKGAYWDGEIKHAQIGGYEDYPVFKTKSETDQNYALCAQKLLNMRDRLYPQFATHNALTAATVLALAGEDKSGFEFQRLHGMGETLHEILREDTDLPCRIYAPVGVHKDLLAYLVRRLLENGANSSFVSQITDRDVPINAIIADPFETVEAPIIRNPAEIYAPRRNSRGWNLQDPKELSAYIAARAPFKTTQWTAKPMLARRLTKSGKTHDVINPANPNDRVGQVTYSTPAQVDRAFQAAKPWKVSPQERAAILRKASDELEARHGEIFALLTREAGKTSADAVAELREAVDFLRFYAQQAETHRGEPRGTIITIAPWNFPLAIFLGQIGAALAAGNAVIAKPAEASSLIAGLAVDILHKAGVPKSALQSLPGFGDVVGAALTSDPRADGVVFTGSTVTAKHIHKSVAANLSPNALFIAETGGINCMIVDSTALPQQAVSDIIASAFQSAGQRCSALRLLYLQDEIYDDTIKMLQDAMDELSLNNPWQMTTDIGPLIDETARARFSDYIENSDVIHRACDLPDQGHFIQPTLIRVKNRDAVKDEIFGPVLHVARFEADQIETILDDVNRHDYALTFGLHTRIDNRVDEVTRKLRVGNIYVNRNQIGAIVESQPFGGAGLSGTGPKAGGPDYLPRFYQDNSASLTNPATEKITLDAAQAKIDAAQCPPFLPLKAIDCPGPTGESNRLTHYIRGKTLCLGPDIDAQMTQVERLGGCAVNLAGLDPADLESLSGFTAVIHWGEEAEQRAAHIALAARAGPILPLVTTRNIDWAITTEIHVCIDTTASGGNAELLSGQEN